MDRVAVSSDESDALLSRMFRSGHLLNKLIGEMRGQPTGVVGLHESKVPRSVAQERENCDLIIKWLQKEEGVQLVGIAGSDIYAGNVKLIKALLWNLILKYEERSVASKLLEQARTYEETHRDIEEEEALLVDAYDERKAREEQEQLRLKQEPPKQQQQQQDEQEQVAAAAVVVSEQSQEKEEQMEQEQIEEPIEQKEEPIEQESPTELIEEVTKVDESKALFPVSAIDLPDDDEIDQEEVEVERQPCCAGLEIRVSVLIEILTWCFVLTSFGLAIAGIAQFSSYYTSMADLVNSFEQSLLLEDRTGFMLPPGSFGKWTLGVAGMDSFMQNIEFFVMSVVSRPDVRTLMGLIFTEVVLACIGVCLTAVTSLVAFIDFLLVRPESLPKRGLFILDLFLLTVSTALFITTLAVGFSQDSGVFVATIGQVIPYVFNTPTSPPPPPTPVPDAVRLGLALGLGLGIALLTAGGILVYSIFRCRAYLAPMDPPTSRCYDCGALTKSTKFCHTCLQRKMQKVQSRVVCSVCSSTYSTWKKRKEPCASCRVVGCRNCLKQYRLRSRGEDKVTIFCEKCASVALDPCSFCHKAGSSRFCRECSKRGCVSCVMRFRVNREERFWCDECVNVMIDSMNTRKDLLIARRKRFGMAFRLTMLLPLMIAFACMVVFGLGLGVGLGVGLMPKSIATTAPTTAPAGPTFVAADSTFEWTSAVGETAQFLFNQTNCNLTTFSQEVQWLNFLNASASNVFQPFVICPWNQIVINNATSCISYVCNGNATVNAVPIAETLRDYFSSNIRSSIDLMISAYIIELCAFLLEYLVKPLVVHEDEEEVEEEGEESQNIKAAASLAEF